MTRTRVNINLAVVVVVGLVAVAAAGFNLLGTFGTDDRELVVELPDSGGVLEGQPVTVRGVGVGQVAGTELTAGGVELTLEVARDTDVPRHALVQVLRRSPIGEQAVELTPVPADFTAQRTDAFVARDVPVDADWPALEEDEDPDVRGVALPSSVPSVLQRAEDLLSQIDEEALVTVVDELGTAFEGRDDVLRQLTDDGVELSTTLLAASDDIERLLEVSEPTLRTIHDQREEISSGLDSSSELLETLAGRRDEVDDILTAAPSALDEVTRLVDEQAPNLHCLARDLLGLGELLVSDDVRPFLAQLLDNQQFFYGSFDAGTQWDPYRPGVMWARINLLLLEMGTQPTAAAKEPLTATPPTLPGGHCDSPFGQGVDAVRQSDPDPVPADPTSPGVDMAPSESDAGDRADHDLLEEARERLHR